MGDRKVLASAMITSFMTTFMSSALNLSIPALESFFGVSAAAVGWIVSSYTISVAAMSLPMGKLADKTGRRKVFLAGIIGFGRIGQTTGKILKALGMRVIVNDIYQSESGKAIADDYVERDELFAQSDVIFLHCPLFPDTEGMINKQNIAKMKDGVILINNSRGQLVVEQDLADALASGKVYAAALDVVSTEPIKGDNPLLGAKNCLITPHISWAAKEARQRIMDITADNIKAFIEGTPINVVNKD